MRYDKKIKRNFKRKISKSTGIPTTKSGRHQKIGRMVTGNGCLLYILIIFLICLLIINCI